MAIKARDLGCAIDVAKLAELTKLGFIKIGGGNPESEIWQPQLDDEDDSQSESNNSQRGE